MTAATFGKQGVLGAQFHARHIAVFLGTVTSYAHIASDDAPDLTIFNDGFRGGKTGIDLNTQAFSLFGQPAAQVTQADDVVAVVVHVLGNKRVRNLGRVVLIP